MGIGAVPVSWHEFRHGWSPVDAEVIQEARVTLYVNGLEITSLMCTPSDLDALALGFLKNEGLIDGLHSVRDIFISRNECCVEVWVDHPIRLPKSKTITSGCGGGVTFLDQEWQCDPIPDCIHLRPELLGRFFNQLQGPDSLYSRTRGVHTAALVRGDEIIALAEDVGRHNTVDKVVGLCLLSSQETRGSILLTTGRISSEMLRKGAMMGCPLVASRNSPTSMSVAMAKEWNITLVGYVRRDSLRVYAHPERLWVEAPALELPMAGD
jgi:FdhD protein